jgi:peptidyl-prolyl cis-trans isomerase D
MFDLFRSRERSVRLLLGALLVLVAASMLVYLIPGGLGGPNVSGQNVIAAVGSEKITVVDVQRAIQRISRSQSNLPRAFLAMYVPTIVNQMVESKAMAYRAKEMGLSVSDQELADSIEAEVAPATGGKFNMQIYQELLAQQGLTPADFENERRQSMLVSRLQNLQAQSLIVSDEDARAEYARKGLKIGLEYINFDPKEFASRVNKDPGAVKAYFDKNRATFRTPDKRSAELIVGSIADFLERAQVSDQQLRQQYQDNIDSYRTPERVKVRHILIKTQGKPKEDAPKLKAKADNVLKQLQQGASFADLAKKDSDDPGSAEKGGELGWIVRGQTVPNFEKAAFSLPPGQLSNVIETEYGYHIIQVEDKQAAHTQSFDEVKTQLLADAKRQMANADLTKAVDAARVDIARNPSQAEAIAKKYNLHFVIANNIVTGSPLPEVNSAPELTSAIFATAKGGVTQVSNMDAQGKAAFAIVTNIVPAHNAEYAEVQNEVLQKYTTAESERLAEEAAKTAAARARKGESLETIAKSYGLNVKTAAPFTIDGAAEGIGSASELSAAFKANPGDIVGPVATGTGQFVCKVSQKIPADMSQFAQQKQAIVKSLVDKRQAIQEPLFRDSVVADLTRRGKIKMNEANLQKVVASYQG